VVRNIGHVAQQVGGAYAVASWADLDDPLAGGGDDPHGHGIIAFSGAAPLIVDNDIRGNYDGVAADGASADAEDVSVNPRLWSTGYVEYWQMSQRIRYNARFGVAARNGATPYIGDKASASLGRANEIQASGYANVAAQDDAAPRIYYNYIDGNLDSYFDVTGMGLRNGSGYGVIARERAAPVIVGNWIYDHGRAAVAARDMAAPQVGYTSGSWRKNRIFGNSFYGYRYLMGEADGDYMVCNHGAFDNIDCAAVASQDGAQPRIYNNLIEDNFWAGVGSRDWAAPDVRGNSIKGNVIGVAFMSVRDSGVIGARIGGTAAGEGNVINKNEVGIAVRNSGNRVNRVLIEGNDIHENRTTEQGVGIALSNSYVEIVDNDIRNNAYANTDPGRKAGIAVFNNSDALIKYNRILDNRGPGIAVLDSVVEVEHNLLAGNWGGKYASGVVVAGVDCEHMVDYLFNGEFEDYSWSGDSYDYEVAPEWKRQGDIWAAENNSVVSEGWAAQEFGEGGESSRYVYYPGMVSVGREYYFKGWV
jgi:hypothetical protein